MCISWGRISKVGPGTWARTGRDSHGELHLLKGTEADVRNVEGTHYWKLCDRWYVQQGGSTLSDNERDVFSYTPLFKEVHDNMDDVIRLMIMNYAAELASKRASQAIVR